MRQVDRMTMNFASTLPWHASTGLNGHWLVFSTINVSGSRSQTTEKKGGARTFLGDHLELERQVEVATQRVPVVH